MNKCFTHYSHVLHRAYRDCVNAQQKIIFDVLKLENDLADSIKFHIHPKGLIVHKWEPQTWILSQVKLFSFITSSLMNFQILSFLVVPDSFIVLNESMHILFYNNYQCNFYYFCVYIFILYCICSVLFCVNIFFTLLYLSITVMSIVFYVLIFSYFAISKCHCSINL